MGTQSQAPHLPALEDLGCDLRDRGYSPSELKPLSFPPSPGRSSLGHDPLPAYSHAEHSAGGYPHGQAPHSRIHPTATHPSQLRFIEKPVPAKRGRNRPPSSREGPAPGTGSAMPSRNPFKGWWPDREWVLAAYTMRLLMCSPS